MFYNLLMLEDKLDVLVSESHKVGTQQCHDNKQYARRIEIHLVNTPEQP